MRSTVRSVSAGAIVAVTALIGVVFAAQLPAQVAIHFGPQGQPDDYAAKTVALALIPAVQLVLLGLFTLLPRIDPLGENISDFRSAYDSLVLLLVAFLGYIHALVVLWNVGYDISVLQALVPAVAVLYYALGGVVERAEQNWFVGFRTPWTLSNEQVWADTHALGGTLLKVAAVLTVGGLVFPAYATAFIVAPIVLVALFATAYSYWDYRRIASAAA